MKTLHLNLIRKWWLLHQTVKTEDYREITGYWVQRLFTHFDGTKIDKGYSQQIAFSINDAGLDETVRLYSLLIHHYDICKLKNGYQKNAPVFYKQYLNDVSTSIGNPDWGAPDYPVFIIKLGKITS